MTEFNVSLVGQVKKGSDIDIAQAYHVVLDKDILDGLDDVTIRALATDAKIINMQGIIRRKGLNRDMVIPYLKEQGFDAITSDYEFAEAKPVDNKKIKIALATAMTIQSGKKVTPDMVTEEMIAIYKSM